jgi:hypothetical protein
LEKHMKIKTSELIEAALDWAVAKCENVEPDENNKPIWFGDGDERVEYTPSSDWAQGGPIIEREGIGLDQYADYPRWQAFTPAPEQPSGQAVCNGPTPLIAAMRCYVASKLGDDVDVPEELL